MCELFPFISYFCISIISIFIYYKSEITGLIIISLFFRE